MANFIFNLNLKFYLAFKFSRININKLLGLAPSKIFSGYTPQFFSFIFLRGSALFERRRNYEREREADAKDRHEERKELEELKKMILKEKKSGEDDGKKVTNGTEKINEVFDIILTFIKYYFSYSI